MLTACRQSELLALRWENVHEDHFDIEASWRIRYHQLGPTIIAPVVILDTALIRRSVDTGERITPAQAKAPLHAAMWRRTLI